MVLGAAYWGLPFFFQDKREKSKAQVGAGILMRWNGLEGLEPVFLQPQPSPCARGSRRSDSHGLPLRTNCEESRPE